LRELAQPICYAAARIFSDARPPFGAHACGP